MLEHPDAILGSSCKLPGRRGGGGPRDGGDRGGELEELAENGADSGLLSGERRREVSDDEDRRSSVSDPCVA